MPRGGTQKHRNSAGVRGDSGRSGRGEGAWPPCRYQRLRDATAACCGDSVSPGFILSRTVPTLALLDIKGDRMTEPSTSWQLDAITYSGGTQDGPHANVKLSRAGEQVQAEGSGTGLVDAVCNSISQATGVEERVVAFRAYSVGPGSEAVGEVELEVELPGRRVAVRASSTDVVEAAGLALLAALNQYNAKPPARG